MLTVGVNWSEAKQRESVYLCSKCMAASVYDNNKNTNSIHRIATQMAGGLRQYKLLPRDTRLELRASAKILHENSMDISRNIVELEGRSKAGFVYIVSNPAWPEFVKIGHAFDPQDRLSSFNTGDPHRAYVIEHTRYFEDRVAAEAGMHALLADCRAEGEWFRISADDAFLRLSFSTCGATA